MWKIRAFLAAAIVGLPAVMCVPAAAVAQTAAPSGVGDAVNPTLPPEDTLETTYTLAMGTGSRAGATGASALALNTSNMAAAPAYHIEAFSQIIPGGGNTYWTMGSTITDSTTSQKLSLGTSFRAIYDGTTRQYSGWDWRTGFAIQPIEQFAVGMGVRWGRMNTNWFNGQRNGPSFQGFTMDASLTITPLPWIKLAGLGYNLVKTRSSLAPQSAGGSVSIAPMESLSFGGDILVDLTTFQKNELLLGAGFQFIAAEMVPLRIGYRRDNGRDLNQITAGTGFNKGKFGFEASLRQTVGSQKESYILIMTRVIVK